MTVREGLIGRGAEPSLVFSRGSQPLHSAGLIGSVIYAGAVGSLQNMIVLLDRDGRFFVRPVSLITNGGLQTAARFHNRIDYFKPLSGSLERPIAIGGVESGRMLILDEDGDLFAVDAG